MPGAELLNDQKKGAILNNNIESPIRNKMIDIYLLNQFPRQQISAYNNSQCNPALAPTVLSNFVFITPVIVKPTRQQYLRILQSCRAYTCNVIHTVG